MIAGDAVRAPTTSGPLEKIGADRVLGIAEPVARWEHHVQRLKSHHSPGSRSGSRTRR